MYITRFAVDDLFDCYTHRIEFPAPDQEDPRPLVRIIHGPNGVGKTRVLAMIDGIMRLEFTAFRGIPFGSAKLDFSKGPPITVVPEQEEGKPALRVTYNEFSVLLDGREAGALRRSDRQEVEDFRKAFSIATELINFEFIQTSRLLDWFQATDDDHVLVDEEGHISRIVRRRRLPGKARLRPPQQYLSERVQRFLTEAQVSFGTYFASAGPDTFERIIGLLTNPERKPEAAEALLGRITAVQDENRSSERFGLEVDRWNSEYLVEFLQRTDNTEGRQHALMALGAYIEMLEARSAERGSLARRLATFEGLVNEFLDNKHVEVTAKHGLRILTGGDQELEESALSSGEYHLLYLMVTALVTRRRGTVIAIDEPEMSLHIKWQRRLIDALSKCASGAEPQFLFATHSPDLVSQYREFMVEFGGPVE